MKKRILYYCDTSHDQFDINLINILDSYSFVRTDFMIPKIKYQRIKDFINVNNDKIILYHLNITNKILKLYEFLNVVHKLKYIWNNYDMVFFSTLQNEYFKFLLSLYIKNFNKAILFIHNIDKWFFLSNKKTIFKNFHSYYKYSLLKKSKGVLFLSAYLEEEARKYYMKDSMVFPFYLTNVINKNHKFQYPFFTILGGVSSKRRNYNKIVDLFAKINNRTNFKLCFLGKLYNNDSYNIIKYAKEKLGENRILYFTSYIPTNEYITILKKSHFVIMDMNVNKLNYGIYKASGAEFEAPANGIPLLVNSNYPRKIENAYSIYYNYNNFINIITKLIRDIEEKKYYNYYERYAILFQKYYLIEKHKVKLEKFIKRHLGLKQEEISQ